MKPIRLIILSQFANFKILMSGAINLYMVVLFLICFESQVFSQAQQTPIFKDGDRVLFVGNSITNNAQFYNFVNLYYATRYPERKVVFVNCGISGDVTQGILNRMKSDILVNNPTWSVLMIGMNDVNRDLYAKSRLKDDGIERKKEEALVLYRKNLEIIVQELIKDGRKLILQMPSIYDQTSHLPVENLFGVNDALKKCADYTRVLANKYNLPVVDYWSILSEVNQTIHKKDSSATIIGNDRVHPGAPGHLVMAYEFLKSTGGSEYVSKIVIEKDKKKSNSKNINCIVENIVYRKGQIEFEVKEGSLPFPIVNEAKSALSLIPFTDRFNKEVLQIAKISSGKYHLFIDGLPIGIYTSQELRKGINLALAENTPQYLQSLKIMELFAEYRNTQAIYRNIVTVEIFNLPDSLKNASLGNKEAYLNKNLEQKYKTTTNYEYYKWRFKSYITNKSAQTEIEKKIPELIETAYKSNKPVSHTFRLTKINN